MKMTDDEKLELLLANGAERFPHEKNWYTVPVFSSEENLSENQKAFEAPGFKSEAIPYEKVTMYGCKLDDLVIYVMNDDSMYPEILKNDKLHLAYRKSPNEGQIAAVMIDGAADGIKIRKIGYGKETIDLIPLNENFQTETYPLEKVSILGLLCGCVREL